MFQEVSYTHFASHERKRQTLLWGIILLVCITILGLYRFTTYPASPATAVNTINLNKLPLAFVPNQGQSNEQVQFQAHALGGTLFFTQGEVVLSLPGAAADTVPTTMRLQFISANPEVTLIPSDQQPGTVNYLQGNDPQEWHTDIPTYAALDYQSLYPGIDLRYDGLNNHLKGTYTVAAHADPTQIQWQYANASQVKVDPASGDLHVAVSTNNTTFTEHAPVAWQTIQGQQTAVAVAYHVSANNQIGFKLGEYDVNYPLVIDPTLIYSTFLGGDDEDSGQSIAVDRDGNAYVTGQTQSNNFPLVNPAQWDTGDDFNFDVFVTKLNPAGNVVLYSTFLGGDWWDTGLGIAVDEAGRAYIAGGTMSVDFPTVNPYQTDMDGSNWDAFVTKLSAAGNAIIYSTYVGGTEDDLARGGIAVDANGYAYIAGSTTSTDYPTVTPVQANNHGSEDVFVTKLTPAGNNLVYSTYLGGNREDCRWGCGMTLDQTDSVYVTGSTESPDFPTLNALQNVFGGVRDAFFVKLDPTGSNLVYSTYLGGSNNDYGNAVALDADGSSIIVGGTFSLDFPTNLPLQASNHGQWDAFITKVSADGSTMLYSTYFGGSDTDRASGVAVDSDGTAHITGGVNSVDFPATNSSHGSSDTFVMGINSLGNGLLYSEYVGGMEVDWGYDIAQDNMGGVYVTGFTGSNDFPTVNPYDNTYNGDPFDAYVFKYGQSGRRLGDLGDVPDSTNTFGNNMTAYPGILAFYPTTYGVGAPPYGPIHFNNELLYYLGKGISHEEEADIGFDEDITNNISSLVDQPDLDRYDDGLFLPGTLPHCRRTRVQYQVTVEPSAPANQTAYVNLWFDWNRNGIWDMITYPNCNTWIAPEWAVQNQLINLPGPGTYIFTTPYFATYNPNNEDKWVRITISDQPAVSADGSGPIGGYELGETEDYLWQFAK